MKVSVTLLFCLLFLAITVESRKRKQGGGQKEGEKGKASKIKRCNQEVQDLKTIVENSKAQVEELQQLFDDQNVANEAKVENLQQQLADEEAANEAEVKQLTQLLADEEAANKAKIGELQQQLADEEAVNEAQVKDLQEQLADNIESCRRETKCNSDNLALGKPTEQSSTWKNTIGKYQGLSGQAVDGCNATEYYKLCCSHTKVEAQAWWGVDLKETYSVARVRVLNRHNQAYIRLQDFDVRVASDVIDPNHSSDKQLCAHVPGTVPQSGWIEVKCDAPASGRYVSIQLRSDKQFLHLCEVEVYGPE